MSYPMKHDYELNFSLFSAGQADASLMAKLYRLEQEKAMLTQQLESAQSMLRTHHKAQQQQRRLSSDTAGLPGTFDQLQVSLTVSTLCAIIPPNMIILSSRRERSCLRTPGEYCHCIHYAYITEMHHYQ